MATNIVAPAETQCTLLQSVDKLMGRAKRLCALLTVTYGESGESLRRLNDDVQDAYMWQCAEMAEEVLAGLDAVLSKEFTKEVAHA